MNISVIVWTQAHANFLKYLIRQLKKSHDVEVFIRNATNVSSILKNYDIDYTIIGEQKKQLPKKIAAMLKSGKNLMKQMKNRKMNLVFGFGSSIGAISAKIIGIPSIMFEDDDITTFGQLSYFPFTDAIIVPSHFGKKLGRNEVRLRGFKELAYLHPNWFNPKDNILDELNVVKDEKFVIVRFNSWDAYHDVGNFGFNLNMKRRIVDELSRYAKVFISTEGKLPADMERYRIPIAPYKIHSALYFASLLISDTQTMTTEAAVLGTPAIRSNSFVGPNDMRNFVVLEKHYGLIYNFKSSIDSLHKAIELIQRPNLKEEWQTRKEKLLKDKIDVTRFMVWFIGNFPESFEIMKENPNYQERFK